MRMNIQADMMRHVCPVPPHKMSVNVQAEGEEYANSNGQSNVRNSIR